MVLSPLRIRRLLRRQYVNTVRDLLGDRAAEVAVPPDDLSSSGFDSIGSAEVALPALSIKRYEESARAVADQVLLDLGLLSPYLDCAPAGPDDIACLTEFVQRFGRRALRRPLGEQETARYVALGMETAADFASFYIGVDYVISAFLQSPSFLYQIEIGEPDPDDATRVRLTGYEMATRLSYFLLDTTPSDELLDAAESGTLAEPDGIRAAAEMLLAQEGARAALAAFYEERFKLRELASLSKDPEQFPSFNVGLAAAMRREALELLSRIVWEEDADYRELLTANYAFVDADLAALYGIENPPKQPGVFEWRTLPVEHGRLGILGQAAFLALEAHPSSTSPTRRGRFVLERLLCKQVPPPPAEVTPVLPADPGHPETMREKLSRHLTDEGCATCHSAMDPIGLGFEHFDAVGAWRADDRGMPLDVSGQVTDLGSFQDPVELAALVAASDARDRCWVRNLYRHATAHVEGAYEKQLIDDLQVSFGESGGRVRELLLQLVASTGFRYAAAPADEEAN